VRGVVQSLDIVPTLLDYAGVDMRKIALSGRSLRPLIENGKAVNEHAFAVQGSWRSVTDGEYKLISKHGGKRKTLYRLTTDPREREDVSAVETGVLARLDEALGTWQSAFESGTGKSRRLPEEAQERLRSLGYIR
jgi:arylsulfatase A-like enzyme